MLCQARADVRPARAFESAIGIYAIIAALTLGAMATQASESWEVLLRHQLQEQQRCVLDKVLMVREVPVGDVVGLTGRIRCTDQREFDFQRENANQKFTIRLCEPMVC